MSADQQTPALPHPPPQESVPTPAPRPPVLAETVTNGVLAIVTGVVVYLCYLVVQPFLPSLAWALALAVVANPAYQRFERRWRAPSLCAGIAVVVVALMIMAPAVFVTNSLVREAAKYAQIVQRGVTSGEWEESLKNNRFTAPLMKRLSPLLHGEPSPEEDSQKNGEEASSSAEGDASTETTPGEQASASADSGSTSGEQQSSALRPPSTGSLASAASLVTARVGSLVGGLVWFGMQMLITLMCLFYFLRDSQTVLKGVRSLLPLSESEADRILHRVNDTIHATIFGSLTVAFIQGCLGGFMFWMLGLPSPLFWGTMMAILAVVPMLGTSVIWAPTAIALAVQGDWTRALILATWGGIAIGFIDNLIYPYLVGNRMRFHSLPVFFAIVGGLALFGAAGVILGPVLLAVTDGLMQVWRHRIAVSRQAA